MLYEACCAGDPTTIPMVDKGSSRYQQVFGAEYFTNGFPSTRLPAEGAFLTALFYLSDCTAKRGWSVKDLQISASTTSKRPDELSSAFAENIGPDEQTILGSTNAIFSTDSSACATALYQSIAGSEALGLPFSFFYSPSKGSLLLDFKLKGINYVTVQGGPLPQEGRFQGNLRTVDKISRVFAPSVDATQATLNDTGGLGIGFRFSPIPHVRATVVTNGVELRWPTFPKEFQLQSSATLGPAAQWSAVTNAFNEDFSWRYFTLPAPKAGAKPRYFRLFWATPQIGVGTP
jgi:hypothetical protein